MSRYNSGPSFFKIIFWLLVLGGVGYAGYLLYQNNVELTMRGPS